MSNGGGFVNAERKFLSSAESLCPHPVIKLSPTKTGISNISLAIEFLGAIAVNFLGFVLRTRHLVSMRLAKTELPLGRPRPQRSGAREREGRGWH